MYTFPSPAMCRTCILILSLCPQTITLSLPSASSGAVSSATEALPAQKRDAHPAQPGPPSATMRSKAGSSTPRVMAASKPTGDGAARMSRMKANWSSGIAVFHGSGVASSSSESESLSESSELLSEEESEPAAK